MQLQRILNSIWRGVIMQTPIFEMNSFVQETFALKVFANILRARDPFYQNPSELISQTILTPSEVQKKLNHKLGRGSRRKPKYLQQLPKPLKMSCHFSFQASDCLKLITF